MTSENNVLCCIPDFEAYALQNLPISIFDYFRCGACQEKTLKLNKKIFEKLRIRPQVLIDATQLDTTTKVQGYEIKIPLGISPTAFQQLAHPDGEIGSAKAVGALGGIFILSTFSTTSLEDVAAAAPNTLKWFQLFIYKDRELTKSVIKRAEKAGYKAIVLTTDANVIGMRYADMKNECQLPPHMKLANFDGYVSGISAEEGESYLSSYFKLITDGSIGWRDLEWLKTVTKLPIILKGILTAEDAIKAVDYGVAGILVSNHGGRQLDTSPATIEALPEITKAVGDKIEVYFDGGVRFGTDIFKALALGAKLVFVGRPALWGLAYNGEKGVEKVLNILKEEFKVALALSGSQKVSGIKKEMVVHQSHYYKYFN